MTCVGFIDFAAATSALGSLTRCIERNDPGILFPTSGMVEACFGEANSSSGCATCWGTFFGEYKRCLEDVCKYTPALFDEFRDPIPECSECVFKFDDDYFDTQEICGITRAPGSAHSMVVIVDEWQTALWKGEAAGLSPVQIFITGITTFKDPAIVLGPGSGSPSSSSSSPVTSLASLTKCLLIFSLLIFTT